MSNVFIVHFLNLQKDDYFEGICKALIDLAEKDIDTLVRSEASSLANNQLGCFEFLFSIIIWYGILSQVDLVNKESKDMMIDIGVMLTGVHH